MSADAASSAAPAVDAAATLAAIKKQVEFYFSKENLATDKFLVKHMDGNRFVPISVILEFSKIKALTSSASQIVEAIKDSSVCSLDSTRTMIKPNNLSQRSTIILRELADATEDDVRGLFKADGCGTPTNVEKVLDQWFVTMADEATATSTALALRKVTFKGAAVRARIKSETVLRSTAPAPLSYGAMPFVPTIIGNPAVGMGIDMTMYPGMQFVNAPMYYNPELAAGVAVGAPAPAAAGSAASSGTGSTASPTRGAAAGAAQGTPQTAGKGKGKSKGAQSPNAQGKTSQTQAPAGQAPATPQQPTQDASGAATAPSTGGKARKGRRGSGHKNGTATGAAPAPAAATSGAPAASVSITSDAHFPRLGEFTVQRPVKVYSKDAVTEIVQAMAKLNIECPASMAGSEHVTAVRDAPNQDLIRKLRSGSMDLAVRHGRPRMESFESVSSYDYSSMMYGEGVAGQKRPKSRKNSRADKEAGSAAASAASGKTSGYAAALLAGGAPAPAPAAASKPSAPAGARPPKPTQKPSAVSKEVTPASSGSQSPQVVLDAAAAAAPGDKVTPPVVPAASKAVARPSPSKQAPAPSPAKAKRGWEKPNVPPVQPVPKVKAEAAAGDAAAPAAGSAESSASPAAEAPVTSAAAPAPETATPPAAPVAAKAAVVEQTAAAPAPAPAPAPPTAAAAAAAAPAPAPSGKAGMSFAAMLKKTLPADAPVFVSKAAPAPAPAPAPAAASGAAAAAASSGKASGEGDKKPKNPRRRREGEERRRTEKPAEKPAAPAGDDDFAEVRSSRKNKRNGAA